MKVSPTACLDLDQRIRRPGQHLRLQRRGRCTTRSTAAAGASRRRQDQQGRGVFVKGRWDEVAEAAGVAVSWADVNRPVRKRWLEVAYRLDNRDAAVRPFRESDRPLSTAAVDRAVRTQRSQGVAPCCTLCPCTLRPCCTSVLFLPRPCNLPLPLPFIEDVYTHLRREQPGV